MTYGSDFAIATIDMNFGHKPFGLTKREFFAAMRRPQEGDSAITKKVAEDIMGTPPPDNGLENIKWWAEAEERLSVIHADALIKALNETASST